jgi:hypothetical protein
MLKRIVLGALIVIVVGVGGVLFFFDAIASSALETGAEAALGVDVNVGVVLLRPVTGQLTITSLKVANPPGFENPYFFTLGRGTLAVSVASLMGDPIQVRRLELKDITITIERARSGTNYNVLLDNLATDSSAEEEETGPGAVIDELLIRNVTAKLSASPLGGKLTEVEVTIPEIRMTDLGKGSADGMEIAEITSTITRAILKAVAQNSSGLGVNFASDLNRKLGRLGVPRIEILGGGEESGLEEASEQGKKLIKGLFGRD